MQSYPPPRSRSPPRSPPPSPRNRGLTRLPLAGRGAVSDLALGLPLLNGRSAVGTPYVGTVYAVVRYGVFLKVGDDLDGLLHVRFMMGGLENHICPEDHYRLGDTLRVVTIGSKSGHLSFGLPLDEGEGGDVGVGSSERSRSWGHGEGQDDRWGRSRERSYGGRDGGDGRWKGDWENGRSPDRRRRRRHRDSGRGYAQRDDGHPGTSQHGVRGRHTSRRRDLDRRSTSHSADRQTLLEREWEQWRDRDDPRGGRPADLDMDYRCRRRHEDDSRRETAAEPDGWVGRKRPTTDRDGDGDGDASRRAWGDSHHRRDMAPPQPQLSLPHPVAASRDPRLGAVPADRSARDPRLAAALAVAAPASTAHQWPPPPRFPPAPGPPLTDGNADAAVAGWPPAHSSPRSLPWAPAASGRWAAIDPVGSGSDHAADHAWERDVRPRLPERERGGGGWSLPPPPRPPQPQPQPQPQPPAIDATALPLVSARPPPPLLPSDEAAATRQTLCALLSALQAATAVLPPASRQAAATGGSGAPPPPSVPPGVPSNGTADSAAAGGVPNGAALVSTRLSLGQLVPDSWSTAARAPTGAVAGGGSVEEGWRHLGGSVGGGGGGSHPPTGAPGMPLRGAPE